MNWFIVKPCSKYAHMREVVRVYVPALSTELSRSDVPKTRPAM